MDAHPHGEDAKVGFGPFRRSHPLSGRTRRRLLRALADAADLGDPRAAAALVALSLTATALRKAEGAATALLARDAAGGG